MKGQLNEIRNVASNGKTTFNSFAYDSIGRITEYLSTQKGIVFRKRTYSYDSGKTESIFDSVGVLVEFSRYENDTSDNTVEDVFYTQDGSILKSVNRSYDSLGNMIQEKTITEKMVINIDKVFDEKGNIIHLIVTAKTIILPLNIKEETVSKITKHENSFIYEYDSVGNWVKLVNYQDGDRVQVINRKITYF